MRQMRNLMILIVLFLLAAPIWSAGNQEKVEKKTVAVVTPYMANATTAYVIEAFKKEAEAKGWRVTVSDTAGDFGMLVSRIEDAVAQNVDAIVLGMGDPAQMTKGISSAKSAGIPVFGLDAGLADGVVFNITSDNNDLGRQTAEVLAEAIGGQGNVIMYTHDPHPGVRARAVGAEAVFLSYPGINIINKFHIDVPGPVENARKLTEDVIIAESDIAGIWAGWDEPAYGTTQALEAAGKTNVKVVGIDGTDFAKAEIDKGGPFIGTIEQDFDTMAAMLADLVADYFEGTMPSSDTYQIPGKLYTK
ncbi:MAG: substrate-binding domain-containing protein [Spirochaetales bacterium]|jgi:ribose transport system substrate-binding protein|nr:substrate-binding domain-containing protein [Spirochaetales bacterium]